MGTVPLPHLLLHFIRNAVPDSSQWELNETYNFAVQCYTYYISLVGWGVQVEQKFIFCLSLAERNRLNELAQESKLSAGEVLRRLIREAIVVQTVGYTPTLSGR